MAIRALLDAGVKESAIVFVTVVVCPEVSNTHNRFGDALRCAMLRCASLCCAVLRFVALRCDGKKKERVSLWAKKVRLSCIWWSCVRTTLRFFAALRDSGADTV